MVIKSYAGYNDVITGGCYWLRAPYCQDGHSAWCYKDGVIQKAPDNVYNDALGVAPAFCI